MFRIITSSLTDKEIRMAPTLGVPVIFLGGNCKDNAWRDEIIDHYGKELKLLDPFDSNYNPKKDAYKELAGIINSDYVIFYKGGEQSSQEKKFLDLIGRRKNLIKEFDDLDSLKRFLNKIKDVKLESISSKIKKCARSILKLSAPFMQFNDKTVDFHFEKLDIESIHKVIDDIFEGKTIYVPSINAGKISYTPFSIKDIQFKDPVKREELTFLDVLRDKQLLDKTYGTKKSTPLFYYDDITHRYELIKDVVPYGSVIKTAKNGIEYEYSCTKIDLPDNLSKEVMEWGNKNVPDKDLFIEDKVAKGREDDIHITVLYGIKSENPKQTSKVLKKVDSFEVRLGLINAFKDNPKYDVLKIEVESGDLEKLHYSLREKVDNENTFPTYKPHVTIAYVKKGTCDKYIGDETFKGKTFKVDNIIFSDGTLAEDHETKLPLGI